MFYKNARIFTPDFRFVTGGFEVKDGRALSCRRKFPPMPLTFMALPSFPALSMSTATATPGRTSPTGTTKASKKWRPTMPPAA